MRAFVDTLAAGGGWPPHPGWGRRGETKKGACVTSGFVAVAGRPNVGKSTLVNALVGEKVAIVSAIPTRPAGASSASRTATTGSSCSSTCPGFQRPIDPLTERMQRTVDDVVRRHRRRALRRRRRARIGAGDRFIARRVFALGKPVIIALNKVDRLKPGHIATQMKTAATLGDFHALHPVSAKTRDGIGELRDDLVHLLPEGTPHFPREVATDQWSRSGSPRSSARRRSS